MPNRRSGPRPTSLALRITFVVALAVSTLLAAFTMYVERSVQSHFVEQDLGELRALTEAIDKALGPTPVTDKRQAVQARLSGAVAGHHGVYFGVYDPEDIALFTTAPNGLIALARSEPAVTSLEAGQLKVWRVDDVSFRGVLLQMRGETVLVAVTMMSHLHFLKMLQKGLWAGALVACVLAVLAAWIAVHWGHAPMRRIGMTMKGVSSDNLDVRIALADVPAELEPLVTSFNEMLNQLQTSFSRLRDFSADIAHELRTPVTNLTTETQVALSKTRDVDAYKDVLYSNLEELERMSKMISDMLFLAQADHRQAKPEMTTLDLAVEIQALFDYFEALADDGGVALVLEGNGPPVDGNRLMLRRAFSNLISNALRYAPRGSTLGVKLLHQAGILEVRVQNSGPEIEAKHLPRLFDRFYRVDPARHHTDGGEGPGLGLAIVKAIVKAHGGAVRATSALGVTCFFVQLPLTQRALAHGRIQEARQS